MTVETTLTPADRMAAARIDLTYALGQLQRAIEAQTRYQAADAISRAMDAIENALEALEGESA